MLPPNASGVQGRTELRPRCWSAAEGGGPMRSTGHGYSPCDDQMRDDAGVAHMCAQSTNDAEADSP
jgi:hypothetical protein